MHFLPFRRRKILCGMVALRVNTKNKYLKLRKKGNYNELVKMRARELVPGGSESFNTYTVSGWCTGMGILGVEYQKAQLGGAGREFLLHS